MPQRTSEKTRFQRYGWALVSAGRRVYVATDVFVAHAGQILSLWILFIGQQWDFTQFGHGVRALAIFTRMDSYIGKVQRTAQSPATTEQTFTSDRRRTAAVSHEVRLKRRP